MDLRELTAACQLAVNRPSLSVTFLQRSSFGTTFRVTFAGDDIRYIKLYEDERAFHRVVRIHAILAERRYGFAPRIVEFRAPVAGHWGFMLESIGTLNFAEALTTCDVGILSTISEEIGEAMALLHNTTVLGTGILPVGPCEDLMRIERELRSDWLSSIESPCMLSRQDSYSGGGFRAQLDRICEGCRQMAVRAAGLFARSRRTLTHGDLWARNVVLTVAGQIHLGGFLDYDYSGYGPASLDTVRFFLRGLHASVY